MGLGTLDPRNRALLRRWLADAKDPESPSLHCARVATHAAQLGRALGIGDAEWLDALCLGGAVHDIGKLAVPDSILKKAGRLTAEEWAVVRLHPEQGARLTRELRMPERVQDAVRHHHEHWDGSGYPFGLAGEQIPLCARVVCVVDIYDALTSDRSYRGALSREEALAVMADEAGHTLDPSIFQVFRRVAAAPLPRPQSLNFAA